MIFATVLIIASIWLAGLALMVVHVRRAPSGFEDASGFHASSCVGFRPNAVIPLSKAA